MREIKFRAWVEGYGYIQPNEIILNFRNGKIVNVDSNVTTFTNPIIDFELEQYTGLKDKNGVEIYDGTKIKFHNEEYVVKYGKYTWPDDADWGCDTTFTVHGWIMVNDNKKEILFGGKNTEVIGNIHEINE